MPDEQRSRSDLALGIARETAVVLLAFMAGAGGFIGALKGEPEYPRDYIAAVGAGALLALAKMIPTTTGGNGRG